MFESLRYVTAGGALLCVSLPLAAKDVPPPPVLAYSLEDDLDCALFTAALLGEQKDILNAQEQIGLASALSYFTGRIEAQGGRDLSTLMTGHLLDYSAKDQATVQAFCMSRVEDYSRRLIAAGDAMASYGGSLKGQ